MDNHDKVIRDAQYRKGLSIAFFNATNAAIELTKSVLGTEEEMKTLVVKWRDFFLAEHKKYYAEVVSNVGLNFEVSETIKKLEATTTKAELLDAWLSLSQDERSNDEIIACKEKLKEQYEKA